MYDPKSGKATEFIDDQEILDSLEYAKKNKNNKEIIDAILEKASAMKGISHREAAVLLECELEEENEKIRELVSYYLFSSFLATMMPPMIHASRNTEMNSKGNTY